MEIHVKHNLRPNSKPILWLSLIVLILVISSCSGTSEVSGENLMMAGLEGMPAEVLNAPAVVQQAYQFAAANPEIMQQIPCYCGCGDMGHKSNYACYIASVEADGTIRYDTHALGCSICVDITQDAMRLLKEGKTVGEIRTYVDETYSRYGPSNMP